jgi:CheY-like chemotaxis protein
MGDRKVAVFVDDDPDFLELIPEVIHHPSYEIRTRHALNGYRIIDEIIKIKPDVLFIDFYLPRANGSQIFPILKAVQALAHLPIYFITGHSEPEVLPFLKGLDYDGIIFKSDALKDAVMRVLDRLDHT